MDAPLWSSIKIAIELLIRIRDLSADMFEIAYLQ